jgi:outer membrane protein assembly factor BamB
MVSIHRRRGEKRLTAFGRCAVWFAAVLVQAPCPLACSKETPSSAEIARPAPPPPVEKEKTAEPPPPEALHPSHLSRGDRARTSRSTVRGPRKAKLKWVFRTQGRVYADAAIAKDGTVYVPSHDGHLYAVDKAGRQLWAFDAMGKIWSSPAIAEDGTIYFGSDADKLFALTGKGEVKWIFSTEMPLKKGEAKLDARWDVDTSPVIAKDGTIYFGCHYFLYALSPAGELKWRFQAGVDRVKIFSSPAISSRGNIFFGTQGKRFFALKPNSEVLWNLETSGDNDSTPCVGTDTVFFASDDGKVRAVKEGSGEIVWETDLGRPVRAPLALGSKRVIAATYEQKPGVIALDIETGEVQWRFDVEPGEGAFYGIQSGALVDQEGYIYFGSRDHRVYCLSPDGKLVWQHETGDQVDSSPVLGPDGTLYIGSDDKRLYAFER